MGLLQVKEGEYEGGFGIWECTWDLLGFLQRKAGGINSTIEQSVAHGHVLELGGLFVYCVLTAQN